MQVAVTMYYLSDEGRFRKAANAFRVAKNTVSMIIRRVTKAISNRLANKYIKLPQKEGKVNESCSLFFEKHGFPQCLGTVNGTHIAIKRPSENSTDYINHKRRYFLNIQAVADHKYCFIDVSVKWSSCVHDARVLSTSCINTKLRNASIPNFEKVIVQNEPAVPVCILGGPAYTLFSFLIKLFENGRKSQSKQLDSFPLSSAGMVIEFFLGKLRARFGCLRRDMDINLNDLIHVIHACFTLYNVCEIRNESISQQEVKATMKYDG